MRFGIGVFHMVPQCVGGRVGVLAMGVQKAVKQVGGAGKGGSQGSYFERLRAVADLRYDDSADDAAHQLVLDKIGACEDLVRQYAQANGFRSQEVRSAIDEWARSFLADLGATRDQLRDGRDVVVQARGVMRQARDLFQANVSDELLTGGERGWRLAADVVGAVTTVVAPLGGFLCFLGVETYFSGLEKERDREREEYCQNVIEQMNASLNEGADRMQGIIDNGGDKQNRWERRPAPPLPGVVDPNLMGGVGGAGSGSGAGGLGGASGPGAGGSGAGGAGGLDGGASGSGGVVLPGRDWASEGFARPGAVQDPPPYARLSDVDGVGLVGRPVNQTVTPNGLVGGYAPPSAVHASDPRWDPSYRIPHDAVSVGRAASSGALGAIAGGAGISARSLLSGAAAAGAKGAATAGLKGAAAGTAGAAGAKGAAGLGAGLKGGAAARGGAGGVMGMGAPAGGAGGEGEDKKRKRRAFTAVFADEPDQEAGPVWDPAHGPGSADDDIVLEVDLDEWGLR